MRIMENLLNQKVAGNLKLINCLVILFIILILATGIKILFFKQKADIFVTLQLCEKTNPYSLTNCGKVLQSAISQIETRENLTSGALITKIKSNEIKINEDETRKNILVDLKLNADKKGNSYYFQNQKLKENSLLFIEGDKSSLQGVITKLSFFPFNITKVEKIIILEIYQQKKWLADSILIGDKETQDNETIAEITDKKISDAETEVITDSGELLKKSSPVFKDIKLSIKVYAEKENNELLFKGKELKVGNILEIKTDKAEFSGIITNVV